MTDEANDRIEGYADGMKKRAWQRGRSAVYRAAVQDARCDDAKLRGHAEWKRRSALPVPA